MKRDLFNHERNYNEWKKSLTPKYIENGLTKENSKLFVQYLLDLETGNNIPKNAVKGCRDVKTLNRLRSKVSRIFILLQQKGIKDISKAKEKELVDFFAEWRKQNHTNDYAKRFRAFWNWFMTKNRREGKIISDLTEYIDTTNGEKSKFVWVTKEEFDRYRIYFDEDEQLILLFCFDTIIRAPTELLSLKVENIFKDNKGAVWVDIPDEISKTFGRKFNLLYSGEQVLNYIEKKKLKDNDYLFNFSPAVFNNRMQKIAKQVFKDKKSLGGDYYKNVTLYDLRHSGAIYFRKLFADTGQSLDLLRHRGGWTDFNMINEYTRLLGMDGYVEKEKTLLQEDKTKMEKEIDILKKQQIAIIDFVYELVKAPIDIINIKNNKCKRLKLKPDERIGFLMERI